MKYILTFDTFIETLRKRRGIKSEKIRNSFSFGYATVFAYIRKNKIPKEIKIKIFVANAFC
jgi:hypothetical protein